MNKILNPLTGRMVSKNGAVGKRVLQTDSTILPKFDSFMEYTNFITKGGRKLVSSKLSYPEFYDIEISYFEYDVDKVIKLEYSYSINKPFNLLTIRHLCDEFRISLLVGENSIGPKVYKCGIYNLPSGGQIAFVVLEKLELVPLKTDKSTSEFLQKQLFELFMSLSRLKISPKDSDIRNIMWDPNVKEFRIKNFRNAMEFKSEKLAVKANIMILGSIVESILGKSCESLSGAHHWHCKNLKILNELMKL